MVTLQCRYTHDLFYSVPFWTDKWFLMEHALLNCRNVLFCIAFPSQLPNFPDNHMETSFPSRQNQSSVGWTWWITFVFGERVICSRNALKASSKKKLQNFLFYGSTSPGFVHFAAKLNPSWLVSSVNWASLILRNSRHIALHSLYNVILPATQLRMTAYFV